jgi:hypothetical protein
MSYTKDIFAKMLTKAKADFSTTRKLLRRIGQMEPQMLDNLMLGLHQKEFTKINCLEYANCCKTISPAIQNNDIGRIAVKPK